MKKPPNYCVSMHNMNFTKSMLRTCITDMNVRGKTCYKTTTGKCNAQVRSYSLYTLFSHKMAAILCRIYPVHFTKDRNIFTFYCSFCLNFFHLLAQKPNLEKNNIYSNKFIDDFHLSESSFSCPRLRANGLVQDCLCSKNKVPHYISFTILMSIFF